MGGWREEVKGEGVGRGRRGRVMGGMKRVEGGGGRVKGEEVGWWGGVSSYLDLLQFLVLPARNGLTNLDQQLCPDVLISPTDTQGNCG